MKVKDLIAKLQEFDPDLEVATEVYPIGVHFPVIRGERLVYQNELWHPEDLHEFTVDPVPDKTKLKKVVALE